ncbi:MAG: hypothetical protein L6R30_09665 [Thermoanaerobaculia bacterium]|nr:hypothetical protein [Myxococcota bacterium]MCK6682668.1 hypothetical protein [Thermoanaerobaculia bacterium]
MDILLIQPRHIYAPDPRVERWGHVYMPTSLLAAAARLLSVGARVSIADENLDPQAELPPIVGASLAGAPYIPRAIQVLQRLKMQHSAYRLILGGQAVSGLSNCEFHLLFDSNTTNGNIDAHLADALGFDLSRLRPPEQTSLIPAYELLNTEQFRQYLSCEFSFYLSQGCRYLCSFCAAEHSRPVVGSNSYVRVRERYRDPMTVRTELNYLVDKAQSFGLSEMQIYLSNLDLFQTPDTLSLFCDTLLEIKARVPWFRLRIRALSNVNSFLDVHERAPELIGKLQEGGLFRLGFGIDGATPRIWHATKKPHDADGCVRAIDLASGLYGFTVEALMVCGHRNVDDQESIAQATSFLAEMRARFGVLPRPHVAKDIVPGNSGWSNPENSHVRDYLLTHPDGFQMLDYTALPSPLTHPHPEQRAATRSAFIAMCEMPGALTQYVLPVDPSVSSQEREAAVAFNLRRYDL